MSVPIIRTETISEAFTIEYHTDGIVAYRVTNNSSKTLELLLSVGDKQAQSALEANQHLRRIIDLRRAGIPNPLALGKAQKLLQRPDSALRYSTAVLINGQSAVMQMARMAFSQMSNQKKESARVFTDENEARQWLIQRLQEMGS